MPMSDEDFKILLDHLKAIAKGGVVGPCPICGTAKWSADGPMAMIRTRETEEAREKGEFAAISTLPLAVITCTKCFYVRSFAWLPIESAAKNHG